MYKIGKDESAFSAIEALLILVILGIIGFTGWYVWNAKQNTDKNLNSNTSAAPVIKKKTTPKTSASDPYAGWKSASLQYEKLSYKYPANWTLSDTSRAVAKGDGCVYPGADKVTLASPSNEQVAFNTGVDCIGDGGITAFTATPITAFGQKIYLAFESNNGNGGPVPTAPQFACLAASQNPTHFLDFKSKNIMADSGGSSTEPGNNFCYYPYDVKASEASGNVPTQTVASIQNSADFNTAKLIFESLKY